MIGIFAMTRFVGDALRSGPKPRLDIVGAVLSAAGLGLIVLGTLQSSVWGLIQPKDAPVEPFGLAPTLFVIAGGGVLLWAFVGWQRHREAIGSDPLVHLDLLKILPLRSGLVGLFTQNLLLMGVFFTIPLYLQLVLGLDALQTGLKMLPVSIAMFAASAVGSRLSTRYSVRSITRTGLILSGIACVDAARDDQARPRRPRVRRVDGRARRRDGADGVAARPRGPVVGRRLRSRRGRWACSSPGSSWARPSGSPSSARSSWPA